MSKERDVTIYILVDPRDGQARYVGKTVNTVEQRLRTHIYYAHRTHTRCARWILGLKKAGLEPIAMAVESAAADWAEAEQFWIEYMRFVGASLCNHTIGGDGIHGYHHTAEARAKMSAASRKWLAQNPGHLRGLKRPKEVVEKALRTKAALANAGFKRRKPTKIRTGFTIPDDVRRKISAASKGRPKPPRTPEHSLKISLAAKGRVRSPELRARVSEKLKGRIFSESHRRKLSEAAKHWRAS